MYRNTMPSTTQRLALSLTLAGSLAWPLSAAASDPLDESPCAYGEAIPFADAEVGSVRLGAGRGEVFDLVADTDYLYICGNFDRVDGVPARNVARWNGSTWEALPDRFSPSTDGVAGSFSPADPCVMEIGPDQRLYIGGPITQAGNQVVINLAAWDLATGWDVLPLGGIARTGEVYALETVGSFDEDPNNDVVMVGGYFVDDGVGNPIPYSHASYHPASDSWIYPSENVAQGPYQGELFSIVDWEPISEVVYGGDFTASAGRVSTNLDIAPGGGFLSHERDVVPNVDQLVPVEMFGTEVLVFTTSHAGLSTTHHPSGPLVSITQHMGFLDLSGYVGNFGGSTGTGMPKDFVQPVGSYWKHEVLVTGGNFDEIDGDAFDALAWYRASVTSGSPVEWHRVVSGGDEGLFGDGQIHALEQFQSPPGMDEELNGPQQCVWAGGDYPLMVGESAGSIGGFCCKAPFGASGSDNPWEPQ